MSKTSDDRVGVTYYEIDNQCNHNIDIKTTLSGVVSYCTYCGKIFDIKHNVDFEFSNKKE